MVDSWLNIPYPDWYLDYVRVHFQAALFPDAFMAAFANAAQSDDERLEEVSPLLSDLYVHCYNLPMLSGEVNRKQILPCAKAAAHNCST